jgi:hypothetical protein
MAWQVADLVGRNCITFEDGQRVFDLIEHELSLGQRVSLDFSGTEIFASPFFNAAVGQLLRGVESERLRDLLKITNLPPIGDQVLRRVIENARCYWNDEGIRARVDAALAELAHTG